MKKTVSMPVVEEPQLSPLEEAEKTVWEKALLDNQGSLRRAAEALGKSRHYALDRIRRFGLKHLTEGTAKYAWRSKPEPTHKKKAAA